MTASEKTDLLQDTMLIGIGASPGIAIGETYMVNRARMSAVERTIDEESIDQQIAAFMAAVNLSKKQLEEVKQSVTDRDLSEHIYIIDTHLMILEDQMLLDETRKLIREEKINAEGALKRTLDKFRKVFETIDDEYLRERRSDMDFVGERLLRNLLGDTSNRSRISIAKSSS